MFTNVHGREAFPPGAGSFAKGGGRTFANVRECSQ
jgi:hypothetical protein